MSSEALAQFSLGLAAASGLVLGLYLAMAGLVFGSVLQQAGTIQAAAIANLADEAKSITGWSQATFDATQDEYDRLCSRLRDFAGVVVEVNFHPARFDTGWSDQFVTASEALLSALDAAQDSALKNGGRRAAREVNATYVEMSQSWAQFTVLANLYIDLRAAWLPFGSDLRRTWLAVVGLGFSFLVAIMASTSDPSVGEHPSLNLAVASSEALFVGALLCGVALRTRQFANRFLPSRPAPPTCVADSPMSEPSPPTAP